MGNKKEVRGMPREKLKRVVAGFILFSWFLASAVSIILALGMKAVLVGCGMAILIAGSVLTTNWAIIALRGEYPTHYGADSPC